MTMEDNRIINQNDLILVTGANGFIGSKVVELLLSYGFKNIRCFVRPSGNLSSLNKVLGSSQAANIDLMRGNLLSADDCEKATEGVSVIYHLAAGIEKTFPGSFLNSVVTTRNLLQATLHGRELRRFLNVSSFAVYTNWNIKRGGLLDESCEIESELVQRYEPYTFAKVKQDELVREYGEKYDIPYVMVRPGSVYGPGKGQMTARVGIDTFGIFLHLGGPNRIPLTYVDNCAEAIVLAGITKGVEKEVFNIVDDDLPRSRTFLGMYKKNVGHFRSIYVPKGQLPPVFNRRRCAAYWKGNRYSNDKLKNMLGWKQRVPFQAAAARYFEYVRKSVKADA
jgi:nucleoside-diphosphate-sugar epimerase